MSEQNDDPIEQAKALGYEEYTGIGSEAKPVDELEVRPMTAVTEDMKLLPDGSTALHIVLTKTEDGKQSLDVRGVVIGQYEALEPDKNMAHALLAVIQLNLPMLIKMATGQTPEKVSDAEIDKHLTPAQEYMAAMKDAEQEQRDAMQEKYASGFAPKLDS